MAALRVPPLETARLLVRPFEPDDLDAVYQLIDVDLQTADFGTEGALTRAERQRWLQWTMLNYEELAKLNQPPYGERAVVRKDGNQFVGACGYVPCLGPFHQLPSFGAPADDATARLYSPEFGLFYAISPTHQRCGYATEAARALTEYALGALCLRRIVATTTYDNPASIAVMRHLGMRIERNPYPDPPWFQVVGILDDDRWRTVS